MAFWIAEAGSPVTPTSVSRSRLSLIGTPQRLYILDDDLDPDPGSGDSGKIDTSTIVRLSPGPTYPDYGERFPYTIQETHGRGVRQRSKKNPKEMRWVWVNYGPSVPRFEKQYWEVLFANQSHVRMSKGKSPYIYLMDDTTGDFGKYSPITGRIEPDWVRCVITYVGRKPRRTGGNVIYEETEMRFIIDDDDFPEIY